MDKIKTIEELANIVNELKSKGKKIVTTNGVFDLLHVGHVRYLREAKKLGDVLLVGINSDSSARAIKGSNRPIVSQSERAEVLAALGCVDYVFIFDERDPCNFIEKLKPDIHVKASDYRLEDVIETPTVKKYGGEVKLIEFTRGHSTSKIIEDIVSKYSKE